MVQAEMYKTFCALTGREKLDPSYHAAFYLLTADPELYRLACPYVDGDGIRFRSMKFEAIRHLDERQRQVVEIARNLFSWTSRCMVTPYDISRLGYPLLDYVCRALYIANGAVSIRVCENAAGVAELVLDDSKRRQTARIYHALSDPARWPDENEESGMEPG